MEKYLLNKSRDMHLENRNTVELRSSGSWLSVSQLNRIGLALRGNLSRILQN